MRSPGCFPLLCVLIVSTSFSAKAQVPPGESAGLAKKQQPRMQTAQLPLAFEPNAGQGTPGADYLARSGGVQAGFFANSVELRLPSRKNDQLLRVVLLNANTKPAIVASEKGGESNYLIGSKPSDWKTHIPQFGRITYKQIYPGIDLVFYGKGQQIEHHFVVQPGADYSQIRMKYEGAKNLFLAGDGDLHVTTEGGEILVRAPLIYQGSQDSRREISGKFVLIGSNEIGFQLGAFDKTQTVVIDPVLDYATYLAADQFLTISGIAVDSAGATYILGSTLSSTYPVTSGAYQKTCATCSFTNPDAFITKLNPQGTAQVYSTFLGGSGSEQPSAIAVDSNGDAIVTGVTGSTDFPVLNPISSGVASSQDGFISSLSPDGASLNFSSRLGGSSDYYHAAGTLPAAVATDLSGNVYVSGITESPYLPVTPGALNNATPAYPQFDVFLTKLQPSGNLVYSAMVGNPGDISAYILGPVGIAVDADNNVYLAGNVGPDISQTAISWPVTAGSYQISPVLQDSPTSFVTKVSPDASSILYSTLLVAGGTTAMALDANREVILAGSFPVNLPITPDAFSSTASLNFFVKLSADATRIAYASYFSSSPPDNHSGSINSIKLDKAGNLWITGSSSPYGLDIPLENPLQSVLGIGGVPSGSAFVSEFDPSFHSLLFSTYFNGVKAGSTINGIALDTQGRAHIAGGGQSDLPTSANAFLTSVTSLPSTNLYNYYGFAAMIDANVPGPGICFSHYISPTVQVGASGQASFDVTSCGNAPLTISGVQLSPSTTVTLNSPNSCVTTLPAASELHGRRNLDAYRRRRLWRNRDHNFERPYSYLHRGFVGQRTCTCGFYISNQRRLVFRAGTGRRRHEHGGCSRQPGDSAIDRGSRQGNRPPAISVSRRTTAASRYQYQSQAQKVTPALFPLLLTPRFSEHEPEP